MRRRSMLVTALAGILALGCGSGDSGEAVSIHNDACRLLTESEVAAATGQVLVMDPEVADANEPGYPTRIPCHWSDDQGNYVTATVTTRAGQPYDNSLPGLGEAGFITLDPGITGRCGDVDCQFAAAAAKGDLAVRVGARLTPTPSDARQVATELLSTALLRLP